MTKKQSESNGVASLENIHEIEKLALPREIGKVHNVGLVYEGRFALIQLSAI
jgi:hypothetical protein